MYAPELEEILQATRGRPEKFKSDPEDVRLLADLIESDGEDEFEIGEQRSKFHLPGQHEQQSHGDRGTVPKRLASNRMLRVPVGMANDRLDIIVNPTAEGLSRWAGRSIHELRAIYDPVGDNVFVWEAREQIHDNVFWGLRQAGHIHGDGPPDKANYLWAEGRGRTARLVEEVDALRRRTKHAARPITERLAFVLARDDFHLPGQHDQQSHGEDADAKPDPRAARVAANILRKLTPHESQHRLFRPKQGVDHRADYENTMKALHAALLGAGYEVESTSPSSRGTTLSRIYRKGDARIEVDGDSRSVEFQPNMPSSYNNQREYTLRVRQMLPRAAFHLPGQHDQASHAGDDARNEASGGGFKTAADGPLPKPVVEAFLELGEAQRGKPEMAMTAYQREFSGVMNPALEHVGDLTHRMTHMLKWGDQEDGREYVLDKTEKTLRWLTSRYGFDREHEENLAVVAKTRFDGDLAKAQARATELMNKYADRHAELPVYNRAQWLGREAAIQLGRGNTWGAVDALRELKGMTDDAAVWNRNATAYRLGPDGKPQPYVSDRAPKSFARDDFHLPGQHDQASHAGDDAGSPTLTTGNALKASTGALAKIAQKVYDDWDENEDEYAGGGICHLIAEELAGHLQAQGIEANTVSAQQGDQHVWVVAQLSDGVYNIDIPPSTYETGGGYSWQKLPGVTLSADDVLVERIDDDPAKYEQYLYFTRAEFHLPGQHDQQSHAGDGTLDKRGSGPGRSSKPDPARIAEVTAIATELGIKRFEICPIPTPQNSWFSNVPPDAIIMGQYAMDSRTVRYNTEALKFPDRLVKDILRHESGHADFHAAFRSRASGVREYVKQNEKRLAAEGRISAYSRIYWRDYDDHVKSLDDPLNYKDVVRSFIKESHDLAVNESFAELRRRFPDKPEKWPPSYRKLDALVRKHNARA